MAKIELVEVAHAYNKGEWAVKDINLTWESGVSSALLGPSGCGKTTLLKIISGLLKPTQGKVLLDGKDVTDLSPRERNIAQVFQFPVVYETLNVFNNLAFPLRNRNIPEDEVKKRVNQVADILDLQSVLGKNANSLGAAEKQLVSLGRGIVRQNTAAILLDEPLTVIDPHMKWQLTRKLKELHQELDFTMVYVTHDQHEALTFADQVTVMDAGRALQTGNAKQLHEAPEAPFVGYFIGSPGMNLFDATLADGGVRAGDVHIDVPSEHLNNGAAYRVGIRPEFVETYPESSEIANSHLCEVLDIHLTGNSYVLDLHGAGLTFKSRVDEDFVVSEGDTVRVVFPPQWLIVYADDHALHLSSKEGAR